MPLVFPLRNKWEKCWIPTFIGMDLMEERDLPKNKNCWNESNVRHEGEKLCYTEDEGRPLGAAMQVEASNHLKLLWSKAMVVSVKEKVLQKGSGKC